MAFLRRHLKSELKIKFTRKKNISAEGRTNIGVSKLQSVGQVIFVNKVLLEHSYDVLFSYYLCSTTITEKQTVWSTKSKMLTTWSFIEKKSSILELVQRPRLRTKMKGFYR